MSTLPVLVTALAEVDSRDRATIEYFARTIRQAGYITTGKRGMGAAKVTAREAANLLIALAGAESARDAPVEIDRFRSLCKFDPGEPGDNLPQVIKDVMNSDTFGEAIDVLVEGTPELVMCFFAYFREAYANASADLFINFVESSDFGIEITFSHYSAKIEVFRMVGSTRETDFATIYAADASRLRYGFYKRPPSDRKVRVTIGLPTLIAVSQALYPNFQIALTTLAGSAKASSGLRGGDVCP